MINSKTLAALIVVILVGGILISASLGWWQTESNKIAATFTEGEFAGQANPEDIRGSYTFADVEKNFAVPAEVLGQAFNVTTDPAAFQIKKLEEMAVEGEVEIGTGSVRLFVAFYKGLPIDLSDDTFLPAAAAALLKERSLTPEQLAYLETHTASATLVQAAPAEAAEATPAAATPAAAPEATPLPAATQHAEVSSDRVIKGKTTFGEILSWGVSKETIEQILGMAMPAAPSVTAKDFCVSNNLNFEVIKPALQAEVDKNK